MHRRPRLTWTPAPDLILPAALAAAGVLALTACSATVQVAPPDRADDPACADIEWPRTIADQPRTTTDPEASWAAAWGDPAVIARCGLPALPPTSLDCVRVDDVDWVVRELEDGTAMSTFGTDPAIEVLVPSDYGPGPLLLPAFGDAARSLPTNGRECA